MTMFREIADIQTAETLKLPTPEVEKHNVAVNATQIQKRYGGRFRRKEQRKLEQVLSKFGKIIC